MNLIWRLTARLVWLWVGILVRGITINVNWQYLVSGSSLPAASWLTRIPPNVGSGRYRWEYTMWSKQIKFKIKSRPKVLIRQATFETDRKHINLSSWRGWIYLPPAEELGGVQDICHTGNGASIERRADQGQSQINTKSRNNTEMLLLLVTSLEKIIVCFA